jgi:hypothetical protein
VKGAIMIRPLDLVKSYLQIGSESQDALITLLAESAEDLIARFCGITLGSVTMLNERKIGDGTDVLVPSKMPVTSVNVVTDITGNAALGKDAYRVEPTQGIISSQGCWPLGRVYALAYTGGVPAKHFPAGLKTGILVLARQFYHEARSEGVRTLATLQQNAEAMRLIQPNKIRVSAFA